MKLKGDILLEFSLKILSVPLLPHTISDSHIEVLSVLQPVFSRAMLEPLTNEDPLPLSVLLPEYSLTSIPCPPSLCLFGNYVTFCRLRATPPER